MQWRNRYEQHSERYEHPKYGTIHLRGMAGKLLCGRSVDAYRKFSGSEPGHLLCTQCFNKV